MLLLSGLFGIVGLVAVPPPVSALTPHTPIVIVGNAEFTGANGVTGGSGTPSDPYIIEGWEIDGSANSGIEIYNTDAHFVIRDVYLHSALIDGIFLYSVQNARVENATMPLNDIGVYIQVSSNVTVASSNISFSNLDAIELDASSNITVEGNEMWINGDWGVFAYESDDLVIRNNTISSNGWAGIELNLGSDRVLVQGNRVANNNIAGLILDQASNVTIIDNTVPDNDFNVDLTNSNDVLIRNNTVATSTSDGITITGGARLTIEENNITGNGGGVLAVGVTALLVRHNAFNGNSPQAADTAGANAWDDGYPSGGNYWSDYAGVDTCSGPNQDVCPLPDGIGDTPYVIDADSSDRYPLMQPYGTGRPGYLVTIIPPLFGDAYTLPFGINETGAVVGWSTTGGFERPFLYTDAGGTVPLPLAPNTTRGGAFDISNTGIVVGFLFGPNQTHAMRWPAGGPPVDLGTMGGPTSRAAGVNATGAVTGSSDYGGPLPKAFLYTDATGFIDIAPLASGEALDANDAGMVVGWAGGGAFRWSDGGLEILGGAFGLDFSKGQAINQAGQVAGCLWDVTPSVERAARFTDGVGWEALGPEADTNCGTGINAYGDVVGTGRPTGTGIVRAFLYTDAGGMQDLELMTNRTPLLRLLAAYDINDRGQIVGYAWDNTVSQYVGYRL
ncbi:MAG TPA: NosD domain-containing protein, partial [Thermoplasmata archaeon]|nr:NosD domain-containing protein [Thermoplasmata archaeon]